MLKKGIFKKIFSQNHLDLKAQVIIKIIILNQKMHSSKGIHF